MENEDSSAISGTREAPETPETPEPGEVPVNWEEKYREERGAFEKFRAETAEKARRAAYRRFLRGLGLPEEAASRAAALEDTSAFEPDENGDLPADGTLRAHALSLWGALIPSAASAPSPSPSAPPPRRADPDAMTDAEYYAALGR